GTPHKALTTVTFVDYEFRKGIDTRAIMRVISDELIGKYPGVQLSVEKDNMGPPAGKAINIEISGQDFEELLYLSDSMMTFIDMANIEGVEGLKSNLTVGKPELLVTIDREKARRYGLSTMQIASTIRTSLFGKEISDFKVGEDEYPIQLRLQEKYRYNVPALMNQKIIFNEDGKNIGVPISAVADFTYSSTYGSVRRKNMDRVITVFSNVIEGYNSTEINNLIAERLSNFELPEGYTYSFTGEQQEQQESMAFLGRAMLIALALILLILVTQFNSVIRPAIILASILFSTIGVFGGIATFKMDFVVVMTGIGIISLAGIVVNNAIVLVDYIELLKARKRKELGLEEADLEGTKRIYPKWLMLEYSDVPVPSNPEALQLAISKGLFTLEDAIISAEEDEAFVLEIEEEEESIGPHKKLSPPVKLEDLELEEITDKRKKRREKEEETVNKPESTEDFHYIPVKSVGSFVSDSLKTIDISKEQKIKAVIGKLK
ncbi:hypothetical protein LCGC14_2522470, partial [marine sediment metagenome]